MSDQAQVIAQIRFSLEQLSERNAEHEWEHLCRHLARERVCSNILPATGPVQAGGDQGRDFETFRTYLARSRLAGRSFVGLISEKPLAFACTLAKKKRIAAKIRSDVKEIVSGGTPIKGVYVFCTADVAVATRHKLQNWARETHGISLEIIDGAAIAEFLAVRELFWLAERFLHLPAELLPALPAHEEEKEWYARTLDRWRRAGRPAQTFAEFSEVRAGARAALGPFAYDADGAPVNQYDRPELPYWIELLDGIADADTVGMLRRRAFYEASVLRLRGLGSLMGQEERLRTYFAAITDLHDSADLEDTQVLLTYVLSANRLGQVNLASAELESWLQALQLRMDERLAEAQRRDQVNESCALLEVRGYVALYRRFNEGVLDPTKALAEWNKLAELLARAPLFPLERFADRLAQYARYFGTHAEYEPLTQAVDRLLAERFGQFKAAEKCLQRATAFGEAGDLPRAMGQLHRAKIDWFAEETLGKSLVALNWLSRAYVEQGLFFAGKYYALAAAYVALYAEDLRLKPYVARSLERAASCDYGLGAWHGFLDLAEICARFYPHFSSDPASDFNNPHGLLQPLIFHIGLLPTATKLLCGQLESYAVERCAKIADHLGLGDALRDVQDQANQVWANKTPAELWATVEDQLAGPPWSDAGPTRGAQWKAHGVTWSVEWANDYETTLAVEEFLAALQVLLSDLAGHDLCLMRSTFNISFRLADDDLNDLAPSKTGYKGFDTHFEPSNAARLVTITLPPYRHFRDGVLSRHDLQVGALSVASMLLADVSLLPNSRFQGLLEDRFAQGLQSKLHIGAPYSRCLADFVSRDVFENSARRIRVPISPSRPFRSRLPETLPWFAGPGPGYDPEKVQEHIRNRYERFSHGVARTLSRLRSEPEFQRTVASLRGSGWRDWHILSAVFHVTMNYRLNHRRIILLSSETEEAVGDYLANQPEPEDAPAVPLGEYAAEKLREQLPMFTAAFAKTYGLELHQRTPDFSAMEDFLAHRYNFWKDDVDHDDPFESKNSATGQAT